MRTDLSVERYEPAARTDWDELVRRARARHFMFERAYMDYHDERFVDCSLFVCQRGSPLAVLPLTRHGAVAVSHGGLTFGGVLSGSELTTARAIEAIDLIRVALRAESFERLVYKPMPHIYHLGAAEEDLFALHSAGASLVGREVTSAIAPGPRPLLSEERRRARRRSRDHSLSFGESERIEEFSALLGSVLAERHDTAPVHSAEELRLLKSRFSGQIRLFTACEDGELVAGTVIFQTPRVAHAQYIAANSRGRDIGALDGIFELLIDETFTDLWFDFGISNERDGSLNRGLLRNKEGYGARAIAHDRYVMELS